MLIGHLRCLDIIIVSERQMAKAAILSVSRGKNGTYRVFDANPSGNTSFLQLRSSSPGRHWCCGCLWNSDRILCISSCFRTILVPVFYFRTCGMALEEF